VSDAVSTTDPRTEPGWKSIARSEELGVTVELGHIDGTYFWVEVAWDDENLEQAVDASTAEEFEALLKVSAWPIEEHDADPHSVNQRLEELLHELRGWAGVDEIGHPAVDLWHEKSGAGASWEVWRFGNRWFHWCFPYSEGDGEFSDVRPYEPPGGEEIPCSDWGLRNDVGPLPRAGTFERIGVLKAWNESYAAEGETALRLEIVRRTAKTAKGQLLVLDRGARLSWGDWEGSERVASFVSIEELLEAVELPSDWFTSGRRASLSIIEPYYSQLSEPDLPLCADHGEPSILLGEEEDPDLYCMSQLCLHLDLMAPPVR